MIFVDASAMVAIIAEEPDAGELERMLLGSSAAITSPIAIFEATLAMGRILAVDLGFARSLVDKMLSAASVNIVAISRRDADLALAAHARYGKGRGHPAQLNMGDCFAYAVAQAHGAALLFKGEDFGHTDIRPAVEAKP
jgi:ribonuclease VapC